MGPLSLVLQPHAWTSADLEFCVVRSVNQKTAYALILAGVLFLASTAATGWLVSNLINAQWWVSHTHQVIEKGRELMIAGIDVETGQRGYVCTQKELFLDPVKRSRIQFQNSPKQLFDLVSDDPAAQDIARKIQLLAIEKLAFVDQILQIAKTDPHKAADLIGTARGKVIMDKLRDQIEAMEDRQQQLLLERRASLQQLQWSVIGAVSIVTIFEVMTLGYVYLLNQKHSLAQEKIRRALEEENQRRRESEEALKIASDNLRRSNQDLQQFVYVASHDLQEPIRAIHGFTSILARKLEPLLTDETRKSMGQITSGAERMRTLIEGLLAYARVESRGEQFKSVDMDALINSIVQEDLKMRIEETGAQVTVEPLPVIQGDEGQLRMLFTNLISNALKYKRDEPPRVKVESVSGKHHNVISVQDNGIGFDQKHADRIFVMFQRLHSRNQYEGTGIGLALCKRVAERHGGTITAKSTPGQGSTFIVSFPKALTQSQSQESVTLTTEA